MAKSSSSQASAERASPAKAKSRKVAKPKAASAPPKGKALNLELEMANRRIRDLEELHRKVGQRLDAAIDTIHKILGQSA